MTKLGGEAPAVYEVAVVGASIAGCTAAMLFAQHGLRVALIERQPDPRAYKQLCTHLIQGSATPVLERLGLLPDLLAAGAVCLRRAAFWTRWGWIAFPPADRAGHGYSLRREKLDPLLRERAARTAGVEVLAGCSVHQVLRTDGRVTGVVVADRGGRSYTIPARLVVGADGRQSRVAALAGLEPLVRPNGRFCYYAYYQGVPREREAEAQFWLLDRDVAAVCPTDTGLTLLACYLTKDKLATFRGDRQGQFGRFFAHLPDGPALSLAHQVGGLRGYVDLPNLLRPAARPGVALIGDAALALDPLFAAGCGWAFQSAAWLVDTTAAALHGEEDLDQALERYRRLHRARLGGWRFLVGADLSRGRALTAVERLCLAAAAKDPTLARAVIALEGRGLGGRLRAAPTLLARAVWSVARR
jgi:2-polyprenyl-6-methoxyphenol hydroxylase-like FAD-dependent oxidoreductase